MPQLMPMWWVMSVFMFILFMMVFIYMYFSVIVMSIVLGKSLSMKEENWMW